MVQTLPDILELFDLVSDIAGGMMARTALVTSLAPFLCLAIGKCSWEGIQRARGTSRPRN